MPSDFLAANMRDFSKKQVSLTIAETDFTFNGSQKALHELEYWNRDIRRAARSVRSFVREGSSASK